MENISIKKKDGTTDVTFVAKRAAGGSNSPAVYAQDALNTVAAFRPTLTIADRRSNGQKKAQKVEIHYNWPVIANVDGRDTIVDVVGVNATATVPQRVADVILQEAMAQFGNCLAHEQVQRQLSSGYAVRS